MKFNKVRLISGYYSADFPIVGADPAGPFILKGVDGLGPPERDIFRGKTVLEGGIRQGGRSRDRQIVMTVGLQPDWDTGQTAEELRTLLYSFFSPAFGKPMEFELRLGNTAVAYAAGDISKMETAIFSKDPIVQITIDCDYPYFKGREDHFQIPYKSIYGPGVSNIVALNSSTAPTGFWMSLVLRETIAGNLILSDAQIGGEKMEFGGVWESGDILTINTNPGNRSVLKTKSGTTIPTSLLKDMTSASSWLRLHPGDNEFRLNRGAFDWVGLAFVHRTVYLGV